MRAASRSFRCAARDATHNVGEYGVHPNPYLSADLCTAANRWNAETWLSHDDRLYSGIVVSPQLPDAAQAEIRRWADHPRMSAVIMGGLPLHRPYGDPLYHPVYEAAAEADLVVAVHLGFGVQPGAQSVAGAAASISRRTSI